MSEQPNFLSTKYPDLAGSKPVIRAVEQVKRNAQETPHTKDERIAAYLNRLDTLLSESRSFDALKYKILERYVTKPEDIPESYWKLQEQIIRNRGQAGDWAEADERAKAEVKRQTAEGVLADQRASLEQWIDYLASGDSQIPRDIKYWIFRSILGLSEYDKEKKEFPRRSKGTVKQFPDINYEALAYVVDSLNKKFEGTSLEFEYDIQESERVVFQQALDKEDFARLYAWANELHNPIPDHLLPVTEGQWQLYPQGSDAHTLSQIIRGKGTGWCTAGEQTAAKQLEGGDFHVFYSLDDEGKPTIPRIAIRKKQDKIVEVRGVAYKQNLDPYMGEVLAEKLKEFSDGAQYLKRDADMQRLTHIETKTKQNESLTRDDLAFLYELESPIEGFGYEKDPRIKELRVNRNAEEDMLVIFECTRAEIAHVPSEINENTKAYVGQLEPGIFQKLPDTLEHAYISFPEKKIRRESVEVGGKSAKELIREMEEAGINISDYAKSMLENREFVPGKQSEAMTLIRLTVADLGFRTGATTEKIYERAEALGLELIPPDAGPHYRLKYQNQPLGELICMGMKQITDSDGDPSVFGLGRGEGGLWLGNRWADAGDEWNPSNEFVFRLRKPES